MLVLPVRPQLGMSLKVLWFWPLVTLKAIKNPSMEGKGRVSGLNRCVLLDSQDPVTVFVFQ